MANTDEQQCQRARDNSRYEHTYVNEGNETSNKELAKYLQPGQVQDFSYPSPASF
jgi:hypothetical protein